MKRILISVMTLVLVVGLVGGGAFAYFNDTETSTGNTFTAGTLDLKVDADPDGGVFDWVDDPNVPTFNSCAALMGQEFVDALNNLQPGYEPLWAIVGIKNAGTCPGIADLHIRNVVDNDNGREEPEPATGINGDLSRAICVDIYYGDKSLIGPPYPFDPTPISVGVHTLYTIDCETFYAPVPLPDAGVPDVETDYWAIKFWIPSAVGNEIMGDSVTFDIEFTLIQEEGAP